MNESLNLLIPSFLLAGLDIKFDGALIFYLFSGLSSKEVRGYVESFPPSVGNVPGPLVDICHRIFRAILHLLSNTVFQSLKGKIEEIRHLCSMIKVKLISPRCRKIFSRILVK